MNKSSTWQYIYQDDMDVWTCFWIAIYKKNLYNKWVVKGATTSKYTEEKKKGILNLVSFKYSQGMYEYI